MAEHRWVSSRVLLLSTVLVVAVSTGLSVAPAYAAVDTWAAERPVEVQPTLGPGGLPATPPGPTPEPTHDPAAVVAVVGDSISSTAAGARYRSAAQPVDGRAEVWWSRVVTAPGRRPTKVVDLAVGGTGYVRRGVVRTPGGTLHCGGTVFADRLALVEKARPDVVIIAGGRNDGYRCSTSTRGPRASAGEQRRAIASFYDQLEQVVRRRGLPNDHVFVTAPWGSSDQDGRAAISAVVETQARRKGFVYVPLSPLGSGSLLDNTHPNARGTQALASEFSRNSGIERVLGGPVQPARAARLTAGSCTASEQGDARRRTWGRSGAEGLVAARLTRLRRAPLAPAASSGWFAAARAAGAQVVARPRAGDVAWWPSQPWSGGARREHVGSVLRTTSGGAVVAEVGAGGRCGRTGYRDAAMPRAYLRFPGARGAPRGDARITSAGSRSVRVVGWAVDPDAAPGARGRIRVSAKVGGRTVGRLVKASTYELDVVVRLDRAARGKKVQVVVEALNVPHTHGRAATRLGSRTLRLAR